MAEPANLNAILKYRIVKNKPLNGKFADLVAYGAVCAIELAGIGEPGDLLYCMI